MSEQLANNAFSYLDGGIDNSETTITVNDGSVFPATGDFHLTIDSEILTCTARSGNDLTVVRGEEGTTGANHVNGAKVALTLTKASLQNYLSDRIIYDTFANRPSAGTKGRLFIGSNTPIRSYDDGSAWKSNVFGFPITEFSDTGFTWVNQGSATLTLTQGYALLYAPGGGGGLSFKIRKKTAPSTPYTITGFINFFTRNATVGTAGLMWRQSSDGKIVAFYPLQTGEITLAKFNSETSFSGTYSFSDGMNLSLINAGLFLRLEDDGTNRKVYTSIDGQNWILMHSVGRTDFMTADEVGFFVNPENNASIQMALYSWAQG